MENIGIIKVSGQVWRDRKLRRIIQKNIEILSISQNIYDDLWIIKAQSKYFIGELSGSSIVMGKGIAYPQYEMIFKIIPKRFLFWRYHRIELEKVEVVH
jgi:hypothetical protein